MGRLVRLCVDDLDIYFIVGVDEVDRDVLGTVAGQGGELFGRDDGVGRGLDRARLGRYVDEREAGFAATGEAAVTDALDHVFNRHAPQFRGHGRDDPARHTHTSFRLQISSACARGGLLRNV